jgi:methionyl-tRNA formyltransferase
MINLYLLGKKGYKAVKSLNFESLKSITYVIIGKDSNVKNDYSEDIIKTCINLNLNFIVQNKTHLNNPIYSIAIGWRWLIKDGSQLIVFHDSLLPKYRGFNPLVTALINGDQKIGASVLFGEAEYDKGSLIAQTSIDIKYPIKIEKAIDLISDEYAVLLNSIISKINSKKLFSKPQIEKFATYSLWRDQNDYHINWDDNAERIKRFIDAVGYPYNGAFTFLNDKKIIIRDAVIAEEIQIENRQPGKVLFKRNNIYTIVCGKGLLKINQFYDESDSLLKLNKFRLRFK